MNTDTDARRDRIFVNLNLNLVFRKNCKIEMNVYPFSQENNVIVKSWSNEKGDSYILNPKKETFRGTLIAIEALEMPFKNVIGQKQHSKQFLKPNY